MEDYSFFLGVDAFPHFATLPLTQIPFSVQVSVDSLSVTDWHTVIAAWQLLPTGFAHQPNKQLAHEPSKIIRW